jgi:hypothetical protein
VRRPAIGDVVTLDSGERGLVTGTMTLMAPGEAELRRSVCFQPVGRPPKWVEIGRVVKIETRA